MAVVNYTIANGRLISEKRSGSRKFYLPDPLGSTRALVNDSQTKTDTFTYWPYGEERTKTGSTPTPFRWTGTVGWYSNTALVYRNPFYNPKYGSWLSAMTQQSVPDWVRPCPGEEDWNIPAWVPHFRFPLRGGINFDGFYEFPRSESGCSIDDEAMRCHPDDINRRSIGARRDYVKQVKEAICAGSAGGRIDYRFLYVTIPCYVWVNGKKEIQYRIRVGPRVNNPYTAIAYEYFGGEEGDLRGLGCVICCLLRHEAAHGEFFKRELPGEAEWPADYQSRLECDGWTKELECLERVLRGEKC